MVARLASRMRRKNLLGAVAMASAILVTPAATVAIVVALHPWPRHGADQIRHLVKWPPDCADVTANAVRGPDRWPHADQEMFIDCEMLGPWVRYARFRDRQALERDLLAASPASAVCIYGRGTEVAVNGLEAHQFPALCRKLHGDRIDGVSGLPDVLPGVATIRSTDRAVRRQRQRDTVAQHRAIARYFSATS
jgi:hypothetical protein